MLLLLLYQKAILIVLIVSARLFELPIGENLFFGKNEQINKITSDYI